VRVERIEVDPTTYTTSLETYDIDPMLLPPTARQRPERRQRATGGARGNRTGLTRSGRAERASDERREAALFPNRVGSGSG